MLPTPPKINNMARKQDITHIENAKIDRNPEAQYPSAILRKMERRYISPAGKWQMRTELGEF